jgi:membrane-bound serine protease (ClpP class)
MLIGVALFLLLTGAVDQALGIALVAGAVVLEILEIFIWVKYLRRHRVKTGPEAMVGETATVVESCEPEGTVKVRGEIWAAHSLTGASTGEKVRVIGVDGLTLQVE